MHPQYKVQGAGCKVQGARCMVRDTWCKVQGTWCMVQKGVHADGRKGRMKEKRRLASAPRHKDKRGTDLTK